MKTEKKNWLKNPTGKQITIISALWITGNALLILAMTDLFTESIFQKKFVMTYFLILGSSLTTLEAHLNYWNKYK